MYKSSKYTAAQNGEFSMRCIAVLSDSPNAMNIDDIKQADAVLNGLTTQKISRVLSYLNEMGFCQKCKDKATGRMMYKSAAVMSAQGYDVD